MASLVLQLQQDAIDPLIATDDLLRKAMLVARKLHVTDIEQWLTFELNGYTAGASLPEYRILSGSLKAFNPYHGWIPIIPEDPNFAGLSKRGTSQSIAELQALANGNGDTLQMKFPPDIAHIIMRAIGEDYEPALFLSKTQILGVLNRIRNTVLEWAISLEEKGILGEGLTFTLDEKKVAQHMTVNNISGSNVIGTMQGSQIQQESPNAVQTLHQKMNLEEVVKILTMLRTVVDGNSLPPEARAQVLADVQSVEAQVKAPSPKSGVIRESFQSARSILEGAAGNAAYAGIVSLISALLN